MKPVWSGWSGNSNLLIRPFQFIFKICIYKWYWILTEFEYKEEYATFLNLLPFFRKLLLLLAIILWAFLFGIALQSSAIVVVKAWLWTTLYLLLVGLYCWEIPPWQSKITLRWGYIFVEVSKAIIDLFQNVGYFPHWILYGCDCCCFFFFYLLTFSWLKCSKFFKPLQLVLNPFLLKFT